MQLDVRYEDSEPEFVTYHSMICGMMKFYMEGSTAVVDDRFDELTHRSLKDGYDPADFTQTEDVIEGVLDLPFVQAVQMEPNDE